MRGRDSGESCKERGPRSGFVTGGREKERGLGDVDDGGAHCSSHEAALRSGRIVELAEGERWEVEGEVRW